WQKGLRGLENGRDGWDAGARPKDDGLADDTVDTLRAALRRPTADRVYQLRRAFAAGMGIDEIHELTNIDPWFLAQMADMHEAEQWFTELDAIDAPAMRRMKRMGFGDRQLARMRDMRESELREQRHALGVRPTYH